MTSEIVESARVRLSNALGEKLASKATAAFCLAFAQPAPPPMSAAECTTSADPDLTAAAIFIDPPLT